MRRSVFHFFALALALAIAPACALADTTYDFSFTFTGDGVSGSGFLTGIDTFTPSTFGNPTYQITSGGGTFNDGTNSGAITLIPTGAPAPQVVTSPSSTFTYDNLITPLDGEGQLIDFNGLLFDFGGTELDFYNYDLSSGPGNDIWAENSGATGAGTLHITELGLTPTPEPGSYLLFGTGLLALAALRFRKSLVFLPSNAL